MLPTPTPLTLWLLAAAGMLVLLVWAYLLFFHHRFWTTRIPPVGQLLGGRAIGSEATNDAIPSQPLRANTTNGEAHGNSGAIGSETKSGGRIKEEQMNSGLPAVLVVIPARDEAEVIARTVADVLAQDYRGTLHLVVVNDNSSDATAAIARSCAEQTTATLAPELAALRRFDVIDGQPLPAGWSGKLWAVEQGVRHGLGKCNRNSNSNDDNAQNSATALPTEDAVPVQFIWLTDADIAHRPQVLRELVTRARCDNRALVSRMALLCTGTAAERWTIPAFVYFFQMLYPFAAIADARSPIQGAAGGCILLERAYLEKIGGIGSLRGALIDDCTLATHVARAGGRLWLELTRSSVSQRGYGGGKGVSNMIARTAYTQLHYSPLRLLGTVFGLFFTFFAPLLLPLAAIAILAGASAAADSAPSLLPAVLAIGTPLAAAAIMFGTFIPMLRFYRLSPLRTLALPLIALFYLEATLKSAVRYYRGKTGNWKGRVYQNA